MGKRTNSIFKAFRVQVLIYDKTQYLVVGAGGHRKTVVRALFYSRISSSRGMTFAKPNQLRHTSERPRGHARICKDMHGHARTLEDVVEDVRIILEFPSLMCGACMQRLRFEPLGYHPVSPSNQLAVKRSSGRKNSSMITP